MKILIVDDELMSGQLLEYELQKLDAELEILDIVTDPHKAIDMIGLQKPDLLFLDIQMPHMTGFEMLDKLGVDVDFKVVFVTAHEEYAMKAFHYFALDFLLKPISKDDLKWVLDNVSSSQRVISNEEISVLNQFTATKELYRDRIVVATSEGYRIIEIDNLMRCEADSNYTKLHLIDGGSLIVSKSLKQFHELLANSSFYRIHQSHLINPKHIAGFTKANGGQIEMKDKTLLSVSRAHKKDFLNLLKDLSI